MSIPKKGSREIVVHRIAYRWRVRSRPTYDQALGSAPLLLAIEPISTKGTVLIVHLPDVHPRNWFTLPSPSVTPSRVANYIRRALRAGWKPATPGQQFHMETQPLQKSR
ncbi:MAG: hypothetical protein C5B50_29315 [Verrucomicrobia bacterium]|nr:MAG: hypothetical protein C5B50_29315 [Verrucomicrobiota bacterium]